MIRKEYVFFLIGFFFLTADIQAQEAVVEKGKTVVVDYLLKIDGQLVDSTEGGGPLIYVHGEGKILPGLSKALEGLKIGDTKNVVIEPKDAYGDINKDSFRQIPKTVFSKDFQFTRGKVIGFKNPEGIEAPAIIWEVNDEDIVVNFNHPLAGKTLEFNLTVKDIK